MSKNHTPTPWAVNDDGYRVESDKEHGWANDGWIVCSTEGPDKKANAELIVAAVNSYASNLAEIERLRAALNKIVNNWTDLHPKDLAQARAALSGSKDNG